jgi:hypothetical protein
MTFAQLGYQPSGPFSIFGHTPVGATRKRPGLSLARPGFRGRPGPGVESAGTPEAVVVVTVVRLVVVAVSAPEVVGIVVVPRPTTNHPVVAFGRSLPIQGL